MAIKIDQEGLPDGTPGRSRTDGLATGARVTLTNTESSTTTRFNLPWAPPGDITALSSLAATEDPSVWTFDPTPDVYGSYLIELIADEGLVTETRISRILAIRTPRHRLVIPALNERGDSRATLQNQTDADNNAIDYIDATLNAVPQAAWWRALHELFMVVDSSVTLPTEQGPGPDDAGKVVVVNEAGSSFELVAPGELGAGDGGGSTASLIRASAYLGNPGTGGYTLSQQGYDSYADAFSVLYPSSVPNAVIYDIEPLAGDSGSYLLRNATYVLRSAGGRADAPQLPTLQNNTDVTIEGCTLVHPVTGYNLRLRGTRASSSIDQGTLEAFDTTFGNSIVVAVYWSARFERCDFGESITVTCAADADGVIQLSDCTFYSGSAPSFTFLAGPGVVRMDARSKFLWDEAGGGTITNGTVIVEMYGVDNGSASLPSAGPEDEGKFVGVGPSGSYVLVDGGGGGALPDGTVEGAPLTWDPFAGWVQGSWMVAELIFGADNGWDDSLSLNGGTASLGRTNIYLGAELLMTSDVETQLAVDGGGKYLQGNKDQAIQHTFTSSMNSATVFVEPLRMGTASGILGQGPAVSFFGAPLCAKRAITGTTVQEQVTSVVETLVALGLVVDNRTPP